ncbi:hypothetical protein QMA69_13215 [Burkholderia pseudomallei]|uniref:hypothetical protein n=1 Tax=Burkholderia pseudomallei TaxID=28450 RepID=UPI000A1A17D6|nr:hypothetical protein [Burkholderia pseudomallei]ARL04995.1 hypothetical protein BOC44_25285 [Burkholderia pseudomallei]ARM04262.1 hypothetical protein BOC59_31745 [Burkholderia pseudomallei]MEB5485922.1 hypothetical protein [Burkholderia pseudomallei]MEB5492768.1 hypothetical protein [Burkholderia pseudomallei]MEB5498644.1 hypothetical protein [Burkholderia pseudomallei]
MPIVPRAYVTPVPDGIVDAEGRAFAHLRGAWCGMRAACSSRAVARGIRFGTPWHPGVACTGDPAFKPFGNATILRIRTSNEAEKRGAA